MPQRRVLAAQAGDLLVASLMHEHALIGRKPAASGIEGRAIQADRPLTNLEDDGIEVPAVHIGEIDWLCGERHGHHLVRLRPSGRATPPGLVVLPI